MRTIAISSWTTAFLLAGAAAANAEIGGTYQESGYGTCLISQAGFNADTTPIFVTGEAAGTVSVSLTATVTFDAATGTGRLEGPSSSVSNVIVPGEPLPYFLAMTNGHQVERFRYATSTNAQGQTVFKSIPDPTNGLINHVKSGYGAGETTYLSNFPKSVGIVTASGVITFSIEEPVVATEVIQQPNGTSQTYYQICNFSGTLTPS